MFHDTMLDNSWKVHLSEELHIWLNSQTDRSLLVDFLKMCQQPALILEICDLSAHTHVLAPRHTLDNASCVYIECHKVCQGGSVVAAGQSMPEGWIAFCRKSWFKIIILWHASCKSHLYVPSPQTCNHKPWIKQPCLSNETLVNTIHYPVGALGNVGRYYAQK